MLEDKLRYLADRSQRTSVRSDFADVRRRTRRMRRTRLAGTGLVVAVVIGLSVGGSQMLYADRGTPVPPAAQTPTATTVTHRPPSPDLSSKAQTKRKATPAQIVDAPDATLIELAVDPSDPQTRAAIWRQHGKAVLAVTDDAFDTRKLWRLRDTSHLVAVGAGRFFVSQRPGEGFLTSAGQPDREVSVTSKASPLRNGEVLVRDVTGRPLVLDPTTASAHPPNLPPPTSRNDQISDLRQREPGSPSLWGVMTKSDPTSGIFRSRVVWTKDGGGTWQSKPLPKGANFLYETIPTHDPQTMAVYRSGDGATLDPFGPIYRTTDGGQSWRTSRHGPGNVATYDGWAVTRPDGSLLVDIVAWSDDAAGDPCTHRACGLYRSAGRDWSQLTHMPATLPDDLNNRPSLLATSTLLDETVTDGKQRLYISVGYDPNVILVSTDGGRTWQHTRAR